MKSPYKKKEYPVLCYKCGEVGYWAHGIGKNHEGRQYVNRYIRHYSHDKFRIDMVRYKNGQLRSRPNGQVRCYIHKGDLYPPKDDFYPPMEHREYYAVCCYLKYGKLHLQRL